MLLCAQYFQEIMAENKIILKFTAKDGDSEVFEVEVDEKVAIQSEYMKNCLQDMASLEDMCFKQSQPKEIYISNVESIAILKKVLEFCEYHADANSNNISEEDVKKWDMEFANKALAADTNQATVYHILMAANFLGIKDLFDLFCRTVADFIKDKSVEEMRRLFNQRDDFTEEEREEILRDFPDLGNE